MAVIILLNHNFAASLDVDARLRGLGLEAATVESEPGKVREFGHGTVVLPAESRLGVIGDAIILAILKTGFDSQDAGFVAPPYYGTQTDISLVVGCGSECSVEDGFAHGNFCTP